GRLETGALKVLDEDLSVVLVDARMFYPTIEEVGWVARQVVIYRAASAHHHGDRLAAPATGAPKAMPSTSDGCRVSRTNDSVQVTDIDAQLQGICRHHR